MRIAYFSGLIFATAAACSMPAAAATLLFDSGVPDGRIATASRPGVAGKVEIEAADDFVASSAYVLNSATFTGLITGAAPTVGQVGVEVYRVFPLDSVNPPSGNVPTRVNSPSDVAFLDRDSTVGNLSFTTTVLAPSFTAANSVLNGINKSPNQTTGGEGPVTGTEVQFNVTFSTPINLPSNHYFFIPQVQVTGGEFYWLSAARPIPGQFGFNPDLQSWVRNANLDPDWLRIGTDIVGGATPPTFNAAFSLTGVAVPEPASAILFGVGGLASLIALKLRAIRKKTYPHLGPSEARRIR